MKIRNRAAWRALLAIICGSAFTLSAHAEVQRIDVTEKSAQKSSSAENASPHNLFMWKVTGKKGTVYLLGSMHMVPPNFYPLPKPIEKAFSNSQVLVLEMDESKEDAAKMQQLTLARGLYPEGDSIDKHLTKETNTALAKYLAKGGPTPPQLNRMRPWLLSMSIPMTELQARGFDPKLGIDRHFLKEAKDSGKPIDELESAQFQFDMLSGFSDDLQDKLLMSSIVDASNTDRDTEGMVHAWKNGDPAEMNEVVSRDEREHPELKPIMEELVYKRNQGMLKKIEDYLNTDKNYFVVVGAGHLVGDRGLVEELKRAGYTVTQSTGG